VPRTVVSVTVVEGLATGVVRIAATTERLGVVAEDRDDITVQGDAGAHVEGDVLTLDAHGHLNVRVPRGTSLVIGTTSGRIGVRGAVGSCSISTESGRVAVEHARRLDVRSRSGRVEVGTVEEGCRVHVLSGRIQVRSCGDADVSTEQGRIQLSDARGTVRAHCVSGRIEIDLDGAHDVDASTVSGRIEVTHPPGATVEHVTERSTEPGAGTGASCVVVARSVSGRVTVRPR
jgi:DUF4097 and DUF4098 domain-containing protein YvlB